MAVEERYLQLPSDGSPRRPTCKEVLRKLVPIIEWLPSYRGKENLVKDVACGVTLGCVLFAQSLAHAALSKVSLITGPYSCLLPPLLYSLFGTCVQASVGTGGLVALLTGEQLGQVSGGEERRTHASAIFTLEVGLVIGSMGVFQLAFLVRFLSKPALSGFITASAILIILSQVKPAIGLPKTDVGGIFDIILTHPKEMDDVNPATIVFSICIWLFLHFAKRLKSMGSWLKVVAEFKEVVLLVMSALIASRIAEPFGIAIIGHVPEGFPALAWPLQTSDDWQLAKELFPGAVMLALVNFLSSFAAARKFAMKAGYQVVAVNELLALGAANVGGAMCGAVPTQIGLSRMGIASAIGVRSQLGANIFVACVIAVILLLLSPYIYYVPRCALNIIIILGASALTEFNHAAWLWSLRSTRTGQRTYVVDYAVWWVAFLFTLYLGALKGILGAVVVSLVLIVYQVADPPITTLGYCEGRGRWLNVKERKDTTQRPGILSFRPEGPLFYANVERMEEWLDEMEISASAEGRPLKSIILSAASLPFMDTSAVEALGMMFEAYRKRKIAFLIAHASGQPRQILLHVLGDYMPEGCLTTPWTVEECVQFLLRQNEENLQVLDESLGSSPALSAMLSPQVRSIPRVTSIPRQLAVDEEELDEQEDGKRLQVRPLRASAVFASSSNLLSLPAK